jgi:hypothetical protein
MKKRRGIALVAISLFSVASLLSLAALAGCSHQNDLGPSSSPVAAYTPRPTLTHIVRFEKYGNAADNLEFFTQLHTALLKRHPNAGGELFVNTLVAGGFSKKSIEVTPDKTVSGYDVDSLEVSVRIGRQCIVGQKGPNGYSSVVLPRLGTGHCLVGKTRPINW